MRFSTADTPAASSPGFNVQTTAAYRTCPGANSRTTHEGGGSAATSGIGEARSASVTASVNSCGSHVYGIVNGMNCRRDLESTITGERVRMLLGTMTESPSGVSIEVCRSRTCLTHPAASAHLM